MSEKTKYSGAIPWVIALCMAIIILFGADYFSIDVFFAPVNLALGVSSVQAINEFSEGVPGTDPFWYQRLAILGSVILFFVVGPALWMMSTKSSANSKSISWYAGVTLVMMGFIIGIMGIANYRFLRGESWEKNQEQIERSRNIDEIRAELNTLQNRAMELYWLPARQGGTGGELSTIALADLKQGDTFANTYVIKKSAEDSTITIYGIGRLSGDNPDFKNANGQQGKIQLAVQLTPQNLDANWLKADSLKN